MTLRAPFPYFGGKARVAPLVWEALGDVAHYIEPFCGGAAVLLARPAHHDIRYETINDANCWIANFWRACAADPNAVEQAMDWPINEADLHARARALMQSEPAFRERMHNEPDFCDPKLAGWWAWGQSSAILGNWMATKGLNATTQLGPAYGVHAASRATCVEIQQRLRKVRVCSGDWERVTTATWNRLGTSGFYLDPPYSHDIGRENTCYGDHDVDVTRAVESWCREHGEKHRIVLSGYEDEYDLPGWRTREWEAAGGMDRLAQTEKSRGKDNRKRERLYLSPATVALKQMSLLEGA